MATEPKSDFHSRDRWLMFALILGPAAWMLHLNLSYFLVPESCQQGTKGMLHIITIACLLLALLAAGIGWRIRRECVAETAGLLWQDRTKFMATMVVVLSIGVMVVIFAQQIPNFLLRSCD